MPELGEIKLAKDIGRKGTYHYMWCSCGKCGVQRWVNFTLKLGKPKTKICHACQTQYMRSKGPSGRGEQSSGWKGGRSITGDGYVMVYIKSDDFFYPMAKESSKKRDIGGGYVFEHRLVIAKHLGRCLQSWEIVHHKNHNRSDNQIENLQLVSDDRHKQITIMENRIRQLEARVVHLEAEVIVLKTQSSGVYGT